MLDIKKIYKYKISVSDSKNMVNLGKFQAIKLLL